MLKRPDDRRAEQPRVSEIEFGKIRVISHSPMPDGSGDTNQMEGMLRDFWLQKSVAHRSLQFLPSISRFVPRYGWPRHHSQVFRPPGSRNKYISLESGPWLFEPVNFSKAPRYRRIDHGTMTEIPDFRSYIWYETY